MSTHVSISLNFKKRVEAIPNIFWNLPLLVTGDVKAMFPNIDMNDSKRRIESHIKMLNYKPTFNLPTDAIMDAIGIVMDRNLFCFGDTHFKQNDGIAMGVPPASNFASLYCGTYELDLLQKFGKTIIPLLVRYIDDQFGLWIHDLDPIVDASNWKAFKTTQQGHCSLEWKFFELAKKINFLDLTLSLE